MLANTLAYTCQRNLHCKLFVSQHLCFRPFGNRCSSATSETRIEMNSKQQNLNELPALPFEKILGYLNLKDQIKSRAVSRRWYQTINSFKVKSFCYSERPKDFIYGKSRLVGGAFAKNFISSTRFEHFFSVFDESIFSNLKHLRLCDIRLNEKNATTFAELNSLGQLEELDIIGLRLNYRVSEIKLKLPKIQSFQVKGVNNALQMTLDAPKLKNVKLVDCSSLKLNFVDASSIKKLVTDEIRRSSTFNQLNLLYVISGRDIGSDFLKDSQLEEISIICKTTYIKILEQKQRYGRDLKIYFRGVLTSEMGDQIFNFTSFEEALPYMAENQSTLANEIPFFEGFQYSAIKGVEPELAVKLLIRFIDLHEIVVDESVENVHAFLNLLKSLDHIATLKFYSLQPQDLFDQLPEHCAVQKLIISTPDPPPDFQFLFRLKHLNFFFVELLMDADSVRKVYLELPFISHAHFKYTGDKNVKVLSLKEAVMITVNDKHNECLMGFNVEAIIRFIDSHV